MYKVNEIGSDKKIKKITVFSGFINEDIDKDIFFTKEELENIEQNNIPVHYSQQQIHFDDSIGTIYIKLVNEYGQIFSIEEIYLYCLKETILDPYKTLLHSDNISKISLNNYLSNIKDNEILFAKIEDKEFYNYDDILKLDITGKQYISMQSIGQELSEYAVDPFNIKLVTNHKYNTSKVLSNNLLLNSGEIINNNIYLCLATEVLRALSSTISSQIIKIYYPLLSELKINTLKQLEDNTQHLIDENEFLKDNLSTEFLFKKVDLFYNIYKERKNELKYINKNGNKGGIKYIKVVIHPTYNVKIPLDIIFKLLHASEHNPFIKYNPASRQEKIYRLFTNKISKDGRKIPLLSKADVIRYGKKYGKTKSVILVLNLKIMEIF